MHEVESCENELTELKIREKIIETKYRKYDRSSREVYFSVDRNIQHLRNMILHKHTPKNKPSKIKLLNTSSSEKDPGL